MFGLSKLNNDESLWQKGWHGFPFEVFGDSLSCESWGEVYQTLWLVLHACWHMTSNVPRDQGPEPQTSNNLSKRIWVHNILIRLPQTHSYVVLVPMSLIGCNGFDKQDIRMEFGLADSWGAKFLDEWTQILYRLMSGEPREPLMQRCQQNGASVPFNLRLSGMRLALRHSD